MLYRLKVTNRLFIDTVIMDAHETIRHVCSISQFQSIHCMEDICIKEEEKNKSIWCKKCGIVPFKATEGI